MSTLQGWELSRLFKSMYMRRVNSLLRRKHLIQKGHQGSLKTDNLHYVTKEMLYYGLSGSSTTAVPPTNSPIEA